MRGGWGGKVRREGSEESRGGCCGGSPEVKKGKEHLIPRQVTKAGILARRITASLHIFPCLPWLLRTGASPLLSAPAGSIGVVVLPFRQSQSIGLVLPVLGVALLWGSVLYW